MMTDFTGKVVIVTGGAGDIGQAIGRRLHGLGMKVVVADIDAQNTREFVDSLGRDAYGFVGDLTQDDQMIRLLTETDAVFGGLDILINNMAITTVGHLHTLTPSQMRREIDINMVGPLILTRLAAPYLMKSGDPRIITTTSIGGIQPLPETPIYAATKFGLRGALLAFGLGEKEHGIKVSCVLPTSTDTFMLRQEVLENGSPLNFVSPPQTAEQVAEEFVKHLYAPKLERYPHLGDSILSRVAMVFPNLMPKILPFFTKKGLKGMAAFRQKLIERGDIIQVNGKWVQKARPWLWEDTEPEKEQLQKAEELPPVT
jgi:NAD(P)-dependent dehydrogenase (short-subunit alcohol dehydrogenase family)